MSGRARSSNIRNSLTKRASKQKRNTKRQSRKCRKEPTKHASFSNKRREQARPRGKTCTTLTRERLPNCRRAGPTRFLILEGQKNSSPASVTLLQGSAQKRNPRTYTATGASRLRLPTQAPHRGSDDGPGWLYCFTVCGEPLKLFAAPELANRRSW